MRLLLLFAFCITTTFLYAQKEEVFPLSDSLTVSGMDNKKIIYTIHDLSTMTDSSLGTMKILNHRGELKTTYQELRTIPLKKIIERSLIMTGKLKEMNSLYFVCKAVDGYSAVFSYNELFNSQDVVFIITAHDKIKLTEMPDRPVILSITSAGTAKLGLRGLKSIEIKRGE